MDANMAAAFAVYLVGTASPGSSNLAIMSVVDRYRAVIRLRFLSEAEQTLRGLLEAQGAGVIELPKRSEG